MQTKIKRILAITAACATLVVLYALFICSSLLTEDLVHSFFFQDQVAQNTHTSPKHSKSAKFSSSRVFKQPESNPSIHILTHHPLTIFTIIWFPVIIIYKSKKDSEAKEYAARIMKQQADSSSYRLSGVYKNL